mmetsp:Transcript_3358/g.10243  ORF Transcript_3358/g.10243 Transcript_3358/m.10243 type:complete len:244 (+) Transcript_3358:1317-2048(+)
MSAEARMGAGSRKHKAVTSSLCPTQIDSALPVSARNKHTVMSSAAVAIRFWPLETAIEVTSRCILMSSRFVTCCICTDFLSRYRTSRACCSSRPSGTTLRTACTATWWFISCTTTAPSGSLSSEMRMTPSHEHDTIRWVPGNVCSATISLSCVHKSFMRAPFARLNTVTCPVWFPVINFRFRSSKHSAVISLELISRYMRSSRPLWASHSLTDWPAAVVKVNALSLKSTPTVGIASVRSGFVG